MDLRGCADGNAVEPEFPARLVRQLSRRSAGVSYDARPDGTVSRFKPIRETMLGVVELTFEGPAGVDRASISNREVGDLLA